MFSTSQKSVYSLSVPHALVAVDGTNEICVADREHGRIVCYNYYSGVYTSMFKFLDITGSRLFSLAYSAIDGGKFYVVNGPEPYSLNPVRGFVINIPNRTVEASFSPDYGDFKNPHDVAVNALGNWIYVVELNPMKVHKFKAMFKRNFTVKAARVEVADDSVLRVSDTSGGTSGSLSYTTGQIVLIALIVIIVLCGVPALLYLTVWKNKGTILKKEIKRFVLMFSCSEEKIWKINWGQRGNYRNNSLFQIISKTESPLLLVKYNIHLIGVNVFISIAVVFCVPFLQ